MTTPPEPPNQIPSDQPPADAAPTPGQTATPASPTEPPAGLPPQPSAAPKQGMSGCLKAFLIIGGIVVVLGVVLVAFVFNRVSTLLDDVGGTTAAGSTESGCSFVSDSDASQALGTSVTGQAGDSLFGALLGMVRDTRLLPDAPSCFISSEQSDVQLWVSVHDGSDAAQVFAESRDIASGQVVSHTSNANESLSVETMPFIGSEVDDLGDEAFCVQPGALPYGGVLARRGDRVVFVSTLAGAGGDGTAVLGDAMCEAAQPMARYLLG